MQTWENQSRPNNKRAAEKSLKNNWCKEVTEPMEMPLTSSKLQSRMRSCVCLPMVQCSPFQPCSHWHLPSLQVPCFTHCGLHSLWSQLVPVQPSSQWQTPPTHTPWLPQSAEHTSGEKERELFLHLFSYLTYLYFLLLTSIIKFIFILLLFLFFNSVIYLIAICFCTVLIICSKAALAI